MRASEDVTYRLALAQGFLVEAEQDWELRRWRSCVDNAQLTAENAGKAVLSAFGITPKTHDPVHQIASLLATHELPPTMAATMKAMVPDLMTLGATQHFLTDYGEATHAAVESVHTRISRRCIDGSPACPRMRQYIVCR